MKDIEKIDIIRDKLLGFVTELDFLINEYRSIFELEKNSTAIKFAFFADLKKMYWTYFIVKTYVLLDKEAFSKKSNGNISYKKLLQLVEGQNFNCYSQLNELNNKLEVHGVNVKKARNKAIAHFDYDFVNDNDTVRVDLTTLDEIVKILFSFHRILNTELDDHGILVGARMDRPRVKTILNLIKNGIEYRDLEITKFDIELIQSHRNNALLGKS